MVCTSTNIYKSPPVRYNQADQRKTERTKYVHEGNETTLSFEKNKAATPLPYGGIIHTGSKGLTEYVISAIKRPQRLFDWAHYTVVNEECQV